MARIKIARGSKNNLPGGLASNTLLYGELFWEKQEAGVSDGVLLMGHPDSVEDGEHNKDPLPVAGARAMKSLYFEGLWDAATGVYPLNPVVGSFWVANSDGTGTASAFHFGDWAICIAVNGDGSTQWIKSINQAVTTSDPLALEKNPLDLTAGVISLKYDSHTLTVDSSGKLAVKMSELFTVANGVTIDNFTAVSVNSGGNAIVADYAAETTAMLVGIALSTAAGVVTVQKFGRVTNPAWTFADVGGPVWLGAGGALIQGTENIMTGYVAVQIGMAVSDTTLEINVGTPFLLSLPSSVNYIPLTNTVTAGDVSHAPTSDAVYQIITGASIPTSGNIIPATDNLYDIGSPTARFANVYTNEIHVGEHSVYIGDEELVDDATLGFSIIKSSLPVEQQVVDQVLTQGVISSSGITSDLLPATNNTRSIGSTTKRFAHLWAEEVHVGANSLYVNGKVVITDASSSMTFTTDIDQTVLIKTTATTPGIGNANVIIQAGNELETIAKGGISFTVPVDVAGKDITFSNASVGGNVRFLGNAIHTGDLSVTGNLTVNGTTTTVNVDNVTIKDNIITINSNQTGTPATNLVSGIDVERGDEVNYKFVFVESDDSFKVGQTGSLQSVATREDSPNSAGVPFWNATANRMDTDATLYFNGTTKKLYATSFSGDGSALTNVPAASVANATLTTALTVNTGTLTLKGAAANTSVLTVGAGAVGVSGSNTGDVTLATDTGLAFTSGQTGLALGTPSAVTVSSTNAVSTTTHSHALTLTAANIVTIAGQTAGSTTAGFLTYNGTTKAAGQFDGGTVAPSNTTRLNYDGSLYVTKLYGAVWNDVVDFLEVPEGTDVSQYGKVYVENEDGSYSPATSYMAEGIVGLASDTYGFAVGTKEGKTQIPVAIGGFVLADVDKIYRAGTPLTTSSTGGLTEMKLEDKISYPERIVATFLRAEKAEEWNGISVNGRHWVKVR